MLFVVIYVYWYPTPFNSISDIVSVINSNTMAITSGAGRPYPSGVHEVTSRFVLRNP